LHVVHFGYLPTTSTCHSNPLTTTLSHHTSHVTLHTPLTHPSHPQVNKAYEKYEKQMKAAKQSGKNSKANQEKVMQQAQRQQAKKGKGRSEPVDDAGATTASNVPTKWNDYSVQFHFPEPTELTPPLMQLIDVDFKYPGVCVLGGATSDGRYCSAVEDQKHDGGSLEHGG